MDETWDIFGSQPRSPIEEIVLGVLDAAYPDVDDETREKLAIELSPFVQTSIQSKRIDLTAIRAVADRIDALLREIPVPA